MDKYESMNIKESIRSLVNQHAVDFVGAGNVQELLYLVNERVAGQYIDALRERFVDDPEVYGSAVLDLIEQLVVKTKQAKGV
jgi:hypothetical protein